MTTKNGGAPGQENATARTLVTTTDDKLQSSTAAQTSTMVEVIDPDLVRSWAGPILKAAGGKVPLPGTAAWAALPDDDVRKRAAVIYAAMWWCEQHTAEAITHRADWDQLLQQLDEKQFARAFSASRDWGTCRSWKNSSGDGPPTPDARSTLTPWRGGWRRAQASRRGLPHE